MLRAWLPTFLVVAGCATGATARPDGVPPGDGRPAQGDPILGPVVEAGALDVRVLDVGQGDAILIRGPDGAIVLIDAGPGSGGPRVLEACRRLGIRRIDRVIVSHAHLDHIGGFQRLLGQIEVGEVIDPGFAHGAKTYERFLNKVRGLGVPYTVARRGMEIPLGKGARLVLLSPEEPLLAGTRSDANANSVVGRLDFGDVCMVLSADAELPTEDRILDSQQAIRCPVLKVAHHGSRHSTSRRWLSAVRPQVAVISAGAKNRYGHPADEAIARLEEAGATVYRTDLHGTVLVRTDGRRVMVATENAPEHQAAAPAAAAAGGAR